MSMSSNEIKETLNSITRSRNIIDEILRYGVTEECIARIIQGLALNSEDASFAKSIVEITKTKINSLQKEEIEENNKIETKKKLIV